MLARNQGGLHLYLDTKANKQKNEVIKSASIKYISLSPTSKFFLRLVSLLVSCGLSSLEDNARCPGASIPLGVLLECQSVHGFLMLGTGE
jgi:hypothetical protein